MDTKTTKQRKDKKSPSVEYTEYFEAIGKLFYERDWEINQLRLGVLIKEHVLFKGLPGTAKSMIALKVFNGIKEARIYKNQFTRFQDESIVFGVQLLEEFKKGIIKHNIEGSLIESDFAFLDEFFNANEELLVSTNELLNERTFTRPQQKEESSLICAVMTTNQERENEKEIRAVYDRIMFKSDIQSVIETGNRIDMYKSYLNGSMNSQPTIDFSTIKKLISKFEDFEPIFTDSMIMTYDIIVNEYSKQTSIQVSDRKKNNMLKIVKAACFFRDGKEINFEDLYLLRFALVDGGDVKGKGYFDNIYEKNREIMQKTEYYEKMENLYKETLKEKDKTKKVKLLMGLSKKAEQLIQKFQSDQTAMPLISLLEKFKDKADKASKKIKDSGSVEDTDVFEVDK